MADLNVAVEIAAHDAASGPIRGVAGALEGLAGAATAPLRALGGVTTALGAVGLAANGLSTIGHAVAGVFGVGMASSMEQVNAQLTAMTGSGAAAADILAMINRRAAATPFEFAEMAKATASLVPAAKQSGIALEDLVAQAEILAASNPAEGLEGAAFSLREALSGDFVSVVERFNLPRQRLNELKAQGVPAMKAISIAMKEMGLDARLVTGMSETFAGRWSTFTDTIAGFQRRLGAGLFDGLKQGLMGAQALFETNGAVIGDVMESIGSAVGRFFSDAIPRALAVAQGALGALVDLVRTGDIGVVADDLREAFGLDLSGFVGPLRAAGELIGRIGAVLSEAAVRVQTFFAALAGGETLATTVNRAFGDLIPPGLNAVLDAVDAAFRRVKDTVMGLVASFQSGGLAALWAQAQAVMAEFAPTGERVQAALAAVGAAVRALVPQPLQDFVAGLVASAEGAADGQTPMGALASVVNAVSAALESAVRWLGENKVALYAAAGAVTALGAAWAIASVVQSATTAFAAARVAVLALNAALIANPIGLIVTALGALAGALVYVYNTNEDFRQGVDAAWAAVKQAVSVAMEVIVPLVLDWGATLLRVGGTVVQFVGDAVRAWQDLQARLAAIQLAISRAVVAGWEAIRDAVSAVVQVVGARVAEGWAAVQATTTAATAAVSGAVSSAWDAVAAATASTWSAVVDQTTSSWAAVRGAIDEATGGALSRVIEWGGQLVAVLVEQAKAVLAAAREIGSAITDGVRDGINAAWNALVEYVRGRVQALLDGAKAAAKIGSPSRLFADEVGLPIVQGIAAGIARGAAAASDAIRRTIVAIYDAATGAPIATGGRYLGAAIVASVAGGIQSNIDQVLVAIQRLSQEGQGAMKGLAESIGDRFTGWIGEVIAKRTYLLWRFNYEAWKRGEGTKVAPLLEDATRDYVAKTEKAVADATSRLHGLTVKYEQDVLAARRSAAEQAIKVAADAEAKLREMEGERSYRAQIEARKAAFAEMLRLQKDRFDAEQRQLEGALRLQEETARIAFRAQLQYGRVGQDAAPGVTAAQGALDAATDLARVAFQEQRALARATTDAERAEATNRAAEARRDLQDRLDEAAYVAEATKDLRLKLQREQIEAERQQALQALKDRQAEELYVEQETQTLRTEILARQTAMEQQVAVQQRDFERQLDLEEYARRVQQVTDERDARLAAISEELAAREKELAAAYERERAIVIENLAKQLNDFKTEYLDKVKDAFKQAGVDLVDFFDAINNDLAKRVEATNARIVAMIAALASAQASVGETPSYAYQAPYAPTIPDSTALGAPGASSATGTYVARQYVANVTPVTANVDEEEVGRVLQRLTMVS